jgi:CubicO group peptidase (beta-lactamase class C family)
MTRQIARAVASFMAVTLAASGASAQPAGEAARTVRRAEALRVADAWLSSVRDYERIPALAAGVVAGEELVWAKGYGTLDAAGKLPVTPKTIFSICSISKVFTSVALMQQVEAGKVRLDEPITAYLPWATLKPADGDSAPITLRAILSHSAGLPREADFPYWTDPTNPFPTREAMRTRLPSQTALYPASRYFQYSNLGLTLAGETVEAVSGTPYADYAQAHILGPLGLKDTRTFLPKDLYGRQMAVGYGALRRDGTRPALPPFDVRGIRPAAGYTSTVEDLARFAAWQFRLLRTEKPEILKASTLREMQRVQFIDPDWKTSWGLGMQVQHLGDHTYVGHGGSCPGYETSLTLEPASGTAVIVLENAPEAPRRYAQGVFDLMGKRDAFSFKGSEPAKGVDLEAYAGRYSGQPFVSEVLILPWAGGLASLRVPSRAPVEDISFLKPKGGDVFRRVRDDGSEAEEVRFERDAAGKVLRYVTFSNPRALIPETAEKR